MFPGIQKICILAFVIAAFLLFGNANGSKIAAATRTGAVDVAAAAASTAESITATTTTTLASSNAPATITNDVDAARKTTQHGQDDKVRPTLPPTTATTATITEKTRMTATTLDTTEDATATPYLESKSRAAAVAATKDQGSHDGNEAKTQIKNSKEPTNSEELKSPTESKNTNEQEAATAAEVAATNNLRAATRTPETQPTSEIEAMVEEKATTPQTTATTTLNNGTPEEQQLQNGLYRIKLAEIVTDEFSGLHKEEEEAAKIALEAEESAAPEFRTIAQHYEVLEHIEGDNNNNSNGPTYNDRGKLNIVDLYPMKIEDFNPIIRDANAKLLRERTVFTRTDDAEHRQNLLPNEVDDVQSGGLGVVEELATFAMRHAKPSSRTVNHAPPQQMLPKRRNSISDFTGKLLAEQDGVITEIEQKFQLNEYTAASEQTATTTTSPTSSKWYPTTETVVTGSASTTTVPSSSSPPESINLKRGKLSFSVNHKILHASSGGGSGHDFIDRRVKKSFDFPMHRAGAASDVMAMPHIDFANTKFNTDTTNARHPPGGAAATSSGSLGDAGGSTAVILTGNMVSVGTHPEFSTTKFYNSKELYNEMLQHNKQKLKLAAGWLETSSTTGTAATATAHASNGALAGLQASSRFGKLRTLQDLTASTSKESTTTAAAIKRVTLTATTTTTTMATPVTTETDTDAKQTFGLGATLKPRKFQKELKRAKLLLKTLMIPSSSPLAMTANLQPNDTTTQTTAKVSSAFSSSSSSYSTTSTNPAVASAVDNTLNGLATTSSSAAATSTSLPSYSSATSTSGSFVPPPHTSSSSVVESTATTVAPVTPTTPASASAGAQHRATNPTKSTSKPIARPRILSRLQEKINSLECELQIVPQDSHLWRGNETHELLLPIVSSEHCKKDAACAPMVTTWEGEAEIQSGDILIVEINDAQLNPSDTNTTNSAHNTQVYQVTRSGHEHCDVTEGTLLDITPLVVDGRKLVTLYDKDLTEGVNLLIVVSELWGSQCVRLKVTTKTDNCGENADCSGKGVCFSDAAMEEYECQCCSGFAGPHCEEIDACTPSPCTNNGICVDLSQGHEGNAYQCLCPYGYTGKNCQYELDPCNPTECMNGGTCVGTSMHFRCDCTAGYTGPLCQHSLNECESSPCVHGICVDQEDGFRCFCQPGFAGELCNFEYNECESNPCQNGGECIDHIGSYECRCTKGYSGNRCQNKVDFCANKPCPEGHRCIDHGNDFSCECPGGRNGPDCNQMPRTQCNVNPCTHGGTCWSSGDSFYCACRPGYTGTMCEDEFVVETVVSSSEFMVDDTSARNFNDQTFGSSSVLKSPIELHNAYFGAGVLAAAIFIVAIVVTICHCKVNQTYRKFSTRSTTFFPILGFGRRPKSQKLNKHWLSGKGLNGSSSGGGGNPLRSSVGAGGTATSASRGHLPATNGNQQYSNTGSTSLHSGQLHERPFQRHLAMNLENDMYYTVDFSENSQHSPLIQ